MLESFLFRFSWWPVLNFQACRESAFDGSRGTLAATKFVLIAAPVPMDVAAQIAQIAILRIVRCSAFYLLAHSLLIPGFHVTTLELSQDSHAAALGFD